MAAGMFVLGLDGADPDLLARFCAEGHCPNIAALRKAGRTDQIVNPIGWSDDAVWASFATGEGIGAHGRYHGPDQHYPGVYGPQPFTRRPFEARTFWARLDAAGRACLVMDVPKSPVSHGMQHSRQVSDWLVHGRDHPHPVSVPKGWAAEVTSAHGNAPPSPCSTYAFDHGVALHDGFSEEEAAHWLDTLIGSAAQKATAACAALEGQGWDLAVVVFKELHCASHLFWGDTPRLAALYGAVDAEVGRVLGSAGPDAPVILFAPHGMRTSHTVTPVLAPLITRFNDHNRKGLSRLRHAALTAIARAMGRRLGEAHDLARPVIHNEAAGAIRLNVKGREPMGKVAPGAEYEARCAELTALLLGLRDAERGTPLVTEVLRPQQRDTGANADNLPDLLAIWANDGPITGVVSDVFGPLPMPAARARPGNHTNVGFVTSRGVTLAPDGPAIHDLSRAIETQLA